MFRGGRRSEAQDDMTGRKLRELRESYGASRDAMALWLGVTTSTIYRWEALKTSAGHVDSALAREILAMMQAVAPSQRITVGTRMRLARRAVEAVVVLWSQTWGVIG